MASETKGGARRTARERAVRRLLAAGKRDGLTLRATAERAGMPAGTLAWWRSEVRRRDRVRAGAEEPPVFVEVVPPARGVTPGAGGAVDASAEASGPRAESGDAPFEVELRGGRVLRVPAGYGLSRLVREIEEC
jgi:hypothetical protein